MNREIIFRGKRLGNGQWLYGDLMHDNHGDCYIYPIDAENLYAENKVNQDTIGQFSGLLDKNGKRVFEGDILKVDEYSNQVRDLSKDKSIDRNEIYDLFSIEELKGKLQRTYISRVAFEEGTFCISSYPDNDPYLDTFLGCLFGDMKRSYPIFEFEVVGNIYDNPDIKLGRMFTAEGCR